MLQPHSVFPVYDAVWAVFPTSTDYFPATQPFMVNCIVDNPDALLDRLKHEGVKTQAEDCSGTKGMTITVDFGPEIQPNLPDGTRSWLCTKEAQADCLKRSLIFRPVTCSGAQGSACINAAARVRGPLTQEEWTRFVVLTALKRDLTGPQLDEPRGKKYHNKL
jgi:hypothetical protein